MPDINLEFKIRRIISELSDVENSLHDLKKDVIFRDLPNISSTDRSKIDLLYRNWDNITFNDLELLIKKS